MDFNLDEQAYRAARGQQYFNGLKRVEAERWNKLNFTETEDLNTDRMLMWGGRYSQFRRKWYDTIGSPWFVPSRLGESSDDPLALLATWAKGTLPAHVLDSLQEQMNAGNPDPTFLKYPFRHHPSDSMVNRTPSHLIKALHEQAEAQTARPTNSSPSDTDRIWSLVALAFRLYSKSFILTRFTDARNPATNHTPVPDGSNIQHSDLRAAWVLHRTWIKALHHRSLYIATLDYGVKRLSNILQLSMASLYVECTNVAYRSRNIYPEDAHSELDLLNVVKEEVTNAIKGMGVDLLNESRPVPSDGPWTQDETIEYNAKNKDRMTASFSKNFDHLNKKWLLWATLIYLADYFEDLMNIEHVEDYLMDKRVVGRDEFLDRQSWILENEIQLMNRDPEADFDPATMDDLAHEPKVEAAETTIRNTLGRISEVNRCRRNYLLLRDFSGKRPWKHLYYVFNTAAGEEDYLHEAITQFYQDIKDITEADQPETYLGPSNLTNIWSHLFPIHPIASTDVPARLKHWDDDCPHCLDSFDPAQTIAELHCGHTYHYLCLREMWDTHGIHEQRCSICRRVFPALWEIAGVKPEVKDVWDLETIDPHATNIFPNLSTDMYSVSEAQRRTLSERFDRLQPGGIRELGIEMVYARDQRRKRNQKRREEFAAQAESNLQALDPAGGVRLGSGGVNFPDFKGVI